MKNQGCHVAESQTVSQGALVSRPVRTSSYSVQLAIKKLLISHAHTRSLHVCSRPVRCAYAIIREREKENLPD